MHERRVFSLAFLEVIAILIVRAVVVIMWWFFFDHLKVVVKKIAFILSSCVCVWIAELFWQRRSS